MDLKGTAWIRGGKARVRHMAAREHGTTRPETQDCSSKPTRRELEARHGSYHSSKWQHSQEGPLQLPPQVRYHIPTCRRRERAASVLCLGLSAAQYAEACSRCCRSSLKFELQIAKPASVSTGSNSNAIFPTRICSTEEEEKWPPCCWR